MYIVSLQCTDLHVLYREMEHKGGLIVVGLGLSLPHMFLSLYMTGNRALQVQFILSLS